jgi:hypothetical protein
MRIKNPDANKQRKNSIQNEQSSASKRPNGKLEFDEAAIVESLTFSVLAEQKKSIRVVEIPAHL